LEYRKIEKKSGGHEEILGGAQRGGYEREEMRWGKK
jgi:hypothetical protein